jgi:hypothetical protein
VLRRWEEVRQRELLTEEQKQLLRVPGAEYSLLPDIGGGFLLLPITRLSADRAPHLTAYRIGHPHKDGILFSLCHARGEGFLSLPLPAGSLYAYDPSSCAEAIADATALPVSHRAYYLAKCPEETLIAALYEAEWIGS